MKKIRKWINRVMLVMCLMALILIAIVIRSCVKDNKYYESGDILYKLKTFETEGKYAEFAGLSKAGKTKEVVIVPDYIDGYKIKYLGTKKNYTYLAPNTTNIATSEVLKKIYYLGSYKVNYNAERIVNEDIKAFFLPTSNLFEFTSYGIRVLLESIQCQGLYFPSYFDVTEFYGQNDYVNQYVLNANVTYYLNYIEGNEDVYWFDDCDDELISYVPINPERTGYTFKGWYKDSEYLDKWNFETDIVPKKQYDNDENYIYQETKLYAKWE